MILYRTYQRPNLKIRYPPLFRGEVRDNLILEYRTVFINPYTMTAYIDGYYMTVEILDDYLRHYHRWELSYNLQRPNRERYA